MTEKITHQEAWALIPWLVNGTLTAEEAARLRAHAEDCADCAREIAEQTRLCAAMRLQDAEDAALERSWAAVSASLGVDRPSEPPMRDLDRRRARPARRPDRRALAIGGAAGVAMAAAAAVAVVLIGPPQGDRFITVTDPDAGPVILRLRATDTASDAALRAFFSEHGLVLEEGPSASNVYTLQAPSEAAATEMGAVLEARDDVELVLVGGSK